ncbi:pectate lyase like protein [Zymoseptoria brevis]|uniref:Pectate lyase like protein n=1 Tax=Zymoseptoria brevis TaxID=1047168 RepID=A0A0F4GD57_9PEZI|nr:pectate lyase like protein [Zymoseptoria brevis]
MKTSHLLAMLYGALVVSAWPSLALPKAAPATSREGFAFANPTGPTTGGGGRAIVVTTNEELLEAVRGSSPKIVHLKGDFTPRARLKVGSNTSLLGIGKGANLIGKGIDIQNSTNVIVRNIAIRFVEGGDGITIQNSTRVWVDHCEFESEFSPLLGPDFYDGQIDIVRASDWITISHNFFHNHWKSSLVGNSDVLRSVDEGYLHITYHHNYWSNIGTRGPAGRFGHQHIYNNLYEDFRYQAIHSRSDNQVLVEGNVFCGRTREALSTYGLVVPEDSPNNCVCGDEELDGFANLGDENDFGGAGVNITQVGNFTSVDYDYKLTKLTKVEEYVRKNAGIGKARVC